MDPVKFCKIVESSINRQLTVLEKKSIHDYLRQVRFSAETSIKLAYKYHLNQVIPVLAKIQANKLRNLHTDLDIKEYQKAVIGTKSEGTQQDENKDELFEDVEIAQLESLFLLEMNDVYDLSKAIAPKSKHKYNYLLLDSDNLNDINDGRNKFSWLINDGNPTLQKGYINLHSKLRNIVVGRLGRVTMNFQHTAVLDQAVEQNRFAFGFEEFASQALLTPTGDKFQFISFYRDGENGNYGTSFTLSSFDANRGWFRFRERFKFLDKLTLSITNLNTGLKYVLPDTCAVIPAIFQKGDIIIGMELFTNHILVNTKYLPVNYNYNPFEGFAYDLPSSIQDEYILSDLNTLDLAFNASFNQQQQIEYRTIDVTRILNLIVPNTFPDGPYPFNINLLYKPRFLAVLELISEDDNDDPEL